MTRVVFAGTPEFAVPCLRALSEVPDLQLVAAYCQPDRRAGRGRKLQAPPVKQLAEALGITVRQPLSLRDEPAQATLREDAPDLMVVVAYGLILPQPVLSLPPLGCVNVHASLLPRWRGAAPVARAIEAGDSHTGVALMQMEAGLDTGPVLAETRTPIQPRENANELTQRLAQLGAELLVEQWPALLRGALTAQPQSQQGVSYAHKLRKEEAWLDWRLDAEQLARRVRAFNPWPVAQTCYDGTQILRIWAADPLPSTAAAPAGTVVAQSRSGIDVVCGRGLLRLTCVQRAGGKPLPVEALNNALDLRHKVLHGGA